MKWVNLDSDGLNAPFVEFGKTLQKHEKAEYCRVSDANIAVVWQFGNFSELYGIFTLQGKRKKTAQKSPHSRRNISVSLPTGFVKKFKTL